MSNSGEKVLEEEYKRTLQKQVELLSKRSGMDPQQILENTNAMLQIISLLDEYDIFAAGETVRKHIPAQLKFLSEYSERRNSDLKAASYCIVEMIRLLKKYELGPNRQTSHTVL